MNKYIEANIMDITTSSDLNKEKLIDWLYAVAEEVEGNKGEFLLYLGEILKDDKTIE